ncbi:hypothetical protein [Caballeronia sordidicola]|uniref:hypothetical protein n=1 Tax=Caballeronia sordidicola TaxID=196367 RepID=UPI001269B8F9|nr:hypothetical protein [Caballeronia sordidicola]
MSRLIALNGAPAHLPDDDFIVCLREFNGRQATSATKVVWRRKNEMAISNTRLQSDATKLFFIPESGLL